MKNTKKQKVTTKSRATSTSLAKIKTSKVLAIIIIATVIFAGIFLIYRSMASTMKYSYDNATKKPSGRMFTADSPLNQIIPADVRYRADGQLRIQDAQPPAVTSLLTWSLPIYDVDSTANKSTVFCYVYACDAISSSPVPIPDNPIRQLGNDHHLTVIDNSTRKIYDYWLWKNCFLQPNFINASWCPGSAGVASIDGNGVGGGTNVASLAGGVIRTYEIEQGSIEHAIGFATANTCKGEPIYPALNSDGTTEDQATCIPIGSRIQLDPNVKVDEIPNITKMEKIIAKALQKYGAYADDTSAKFGFGVELDRTGRNVYQNAGAPNGDFFQFKAIPWDKIKILQPQWKDDGSKAYAWGNSTTTPPVVPPTVPPPITPPVVPPTPEPPYTPPPVGNTSSTPPTVPSNLVLRNAFNTSLIVAWGASYDNFVVSGYNIYLNDKLVGKTPFYSFGLTDLRAATTYSVGVSAYDDLGNESAKTTKKFTTSNGCFVIWCW